MTNESETFETFETIKTEKAGYKFWEDDLIIEDEENVSMLVEMEKEA